MDRDRMIQAAQEFFFFGQLEGYLGHLPKRQVPGSPEMWEREIERDGFHMRDEYTMLLGTRRSTSFIWISYEGRRIWWMTGRGEYEKSVIPLMKLALRCNFSSKVFHAGRGPRVFRSPEFPDLVYLNEVSGMHFGDFQGSEMIEDQAKNMDSVIRIHGHYQYWGGLII